MLRKSIFAAALCILSASPAMARDHWVASWGAGAAKIAGEAVPSGGVTYRNIVHMSLGGKQLRLTLSNRHGAEPLTVGGVSVTHAGDTGGAAATATFGGKPSVVIPAGQTIISDPVSIDVPALGNLAVNIFYPAQTISFFTGHAISHQTNYRALGKQLGGTLSGDAGNVRPWRTVVAIDVDAPQDAAAIVAFGDSITDGTGTTNNANLRWPNQLAARLQADPQKARFAVVDEGIGGNRILHAGGDPTARGGLHPSGLSRWSSDALARSGVKYVILLEGVNDIGHSSLIREGGAKMRQAKSPEEPVSAADLIKAMTTMIGQAHAKGIKVIGATMTPYGGAKYERPDGEQARTAINDFIRNGGKFDGVIDFAKATQDPARPDRYLPAYNDKDHLHPNDAGAKAMAASIDLNLFK